LFYALFALIEEGLSLKIVSRHTASGLLICCMSGMFLKNYYVGGLQALLAGFSSERHFLTFFERGKPSPLMAE